MINGFWRLIDRKSNGGDSLPNLFCQKFGHLCSKCPTDHCFSTHIRHIGSVAGPVSWVYTMNRGACSLCTRDRGTVFGRLERALRSSIQVKFPYTMAL